MKFFVFFCSESINLHNTVYNLAISLVDAWQCSWSVKIQARFFGVISAIQFWLWANVKFTKSKSEPGDPIQKAYKTFIYDVSHIILRKNKVKMSFFYHV